MCVELALVCSMFLCRRKVFVRANVIDSPAFTAAPRSSDGVQHMCFYASYGFMLAHELKEIGAVRRIILLFGLLQGSM